MTTKKTPRDGEDLSPEMEASSPIDMDVATADATVWAMRGAVLPAGTIAAKFPVIAQTDPLADCVTPAVIQHAWANAIRLPGLRDVLTAEHPIVTSMLEALRADREHLPVPEQAVLNRLARMKGFAMDGNIALIHGIPLPAGKRQTDYYMALRYAPLFSPQAKRHIVYCRDVAEVSEADWGELNLTDPSLKENESDRQQETILNEVKLIGYDVRYVTDDMQVSLLRYSTALHQSNLVELQKTHPDIYVALWVRDMAAAKQLIGRCNPVTLSTPDQRSNGKLRAVDLLLGTSLMNEFERLFEILAALKIGHGVTRQRIGNALLDCTSMSPVRIMDQATRDFVDSAIVHTRALHPDMNNTVIPATGHPVMNSVRSAFQHSKAYSSWTKRIRWVNGEMPALYFLGVEAEMLAATALIQMIENMEKHLGDYASPGRNGRAEGKTAERRTYVMRLATIITANICVPTARGILRDETTDCFSDDMWKAGVPAELIENPVLSEEAEKLYKSIGRVGSAACRDNDREHKSAYQRATLRAKKCSFAIGKPGWTQGFRFDAWLEPEAEVEFLRNCCRYTRFAPEKKILRETWDNTNLH